MKILFFGSLASGKGLQSKLLAKRLNIPHISSGDALRRVKKDHKQYELINKVMEAGKYVPDKIVTDLIFARLEESDCKKGFILDGFPRTLKQAKALYDKHKIDIIVYIRIPRSESILRATGRRICPNCGAIYNIYTAPRPKINSRCDVCGEKLIEREDDERETVIARSKKDEKELIPLLSYYKKMGFKITEIDGRNSPETIHNEVKKLFLS